jgi:hypothetical protein
VHKKYKAYKFLKNKLLPLQLIPVPFFRELTEEEEKMYSYIMEDSAVAHTKKKKIKLLH